MLDHRPEHPLRTFLRKAECGQEDLAEEAGVSPAFLSRLINRERQASTETAVALQDACLRLAAKRHRGKRAAPTWQQILELGDDGKKVVA